MSTHDRAICSGCPISNRCDEDSREFRNCRECGAFFCMTGVRNHCPECNAFLSKDDPDAPITKKDLQEVIRMVQELLENIKRPSYPHIPLVPVPPKKGPHFPIVTVYGVGVQDTPICGVSQHGTGCCTNVPPKKDDIEHG